MMSIEIREDNAAALLRRKDYEYALPILKELAEVKSEYALLALSWIYEKGLGVNKDEQAARSFLEEAAANGSLSALYRLGWFFRQRGRCESSISAFSRGANLGHLGSMAMLAKSILATKSDPQAREEAFEWLEKSINGGHIMAERIMLDVDYTQCKGVVAKIVNRIKIIPIVIKATKEHIRDSDSERLT